MSIDLTALSADDIERIASWNPRAIIAAVAESNIAVSDTTSTASELNQLHNVTPGAVTASKALVVDSNKRLDGVCVGTLSLGAGAGTAVTSTVAEINALHSQGAVTTDFAKLHAITAAAATLNQVAAAAGTVSFDRSVKVAKVALASADTAGGVFSWVNPEAVAIIITKVIIDVTTIASGACSIDVGTTAVNGTTQSDTLIDGLDVHSAAGVFDQTDQAGALGKTRQRLASGAWVTGSKDSGTAAALAGSVYLHYMNV